MAEYSLIQWLFCFYFYCFFGWCFESTYVSICDRKLTNRGFMKGPFLPIYGSGAIVMLVCSMPFSDNLWLTYIAGCIGATILEYFTGWAMETLFKVRYWDYTEEFCNLQGRICLKSTLAWGGLTILMTTIVHSRVETVMYLIPGNILNIIVIVLTCTIASDFALSFKEAMDLRDILIKLEKLKEESAHLQKRLEVMYAFKAEDMNLKKEELLERLELKKESFIEVLEDKKMDAAAMKDHLTAYLQSAVKEAESRTSAMAEYAKKPLMHITKRNPGMKSNYFKFLEEWKRK